MKDFFGKVLAVVLNAAAIVVSAFNWPFRKVLPDGLVMAAVLSTLSLLGIYVHPWFILLAYLYIACFSFIFLVTMFAFFMLGFEERVDA